MKHHLSIFCAFFSCLSFASVGCSQKPPEVPVDVVSVDSSGVTLTEDSRETAELDWPLWRGPLGNGHASDRQIPTKWDAKTNIAWSADVPGRGHSSPVVVGDQVFLASALEQEQKQIVLAYNRASGEKLWQTEVHSGNFPSQNELHTKGTNANSTVACDGKHLFIGFLNNKKITATKLDLKGEIVWQKEIGSFGSKFGYAPSPIFYKSFVILAADNFGGGYIAALDKETGKVAWRIKRPVISTYSTPAIVNIDNKDQLVISGCKKVESYDPATGELNWSVSDFVEATCGTCVSNGEYIYASGGYPEKLTFCIDGKGNLVWSNKNKVYEPSMLIVDQSLIAIDDKGIINCLDLKTGDSHWRERLSEQVSASPVYCNGLVYAATLHGNVHVFKATKEGMEKVATNKLDDNIYASPAIAGNSIFLRTGSGSGVDRKEKLYCISSTEGAE